MEGVITVQVIPVMAVATAALVQAGAGVAVLEVIPVMAALELKIQEPAVAVLVVLLTVLHTVEPQVAEPALGDKALQDKHTTIVVEKAALEEKTVK